MIDDFRVEGASRCYSLATSLIIPEAAHGFEDPSEIFLNSRRRRTLDDGGRFGRRDRPMRKMRDLELSVF